MPPEAAAQCSPPGARSPSRALAHLLHDGLTDMIYVLLPVWQAQFGLDHAALAALRALYVGVLAAFQVPSGHWRDGWARDWCWRSERR